MWAQLEAGQMSGCFRRFIEQRPPHNFRRSSGPNGIWAISLPHPNRYNESRVQIDLEDLRRYYASLPDEALLELDRAELTDAARRCYDEEVAQRDLASSGAQQDQADDEVEAGGTLDVDTRAKPDWLEDAACACAFATFSGSPSGSDAETAREALKAGGIPCYISLHKADPPSVDPQPRDEYCVMVPGPLYLQATSVLDREIFNPKVEDDWRTHFEALSDEELRALNAEIICAGLMDRMKRLKRVFEEEIARRGLG